MTGHQTRPSPSFMAALASSELHAASPTTSPAITTACVARLTSDWRSVRVARCSACEPPTLGSMPNVEGRPWGGGGPGRTSAIPPDALVSARRSSPWMRPTLFGADGRPPTVPIGAAGHTRRRRRRSAAGAHRDVLPSAYGRRSHRIARCPSSAGRRIRQRSGRAPVRAMSAGRS